MGDTALTRDVALNSLKRKNRTILLLKYSILLTFCVAGGIILYPTTHTTDPSARAIAVTVLCSGIVGLIISLMTDVFFKAEASLAGEIERTKFAEVFAREFFNTYADTTVTDELFERMIVSPARRDSLARRLASVITDDPDLQLTLKSSYLEPFHNPPRFKSYRAFSQLRDYNKQTGFYMWHCHQTMRTTKGVRDFRLFVCCDSDVAATVEASSRATDFLILRSDFSEKMVRQWIDDDFKIKILLVDRTSGKLTRLQVKKHFNPEAISKQPGCDKLKSTDGMYCEITWPNTDDEDVEIDIEFKCPLSMKIDPFFVWTLQDYAFIDLIEIDYGGLLPSCGRVSAIPYLRNPACQIMHERKDGSFKMHVGGLAGPGEGALLILRPEGSNA